MPLNDQDSKYIAKKLSIPSKLLQTLTETDRDTELLLSQASIRNIKKQDVLKLTFFTYIKLVVYRYAFDTGFGIDEKLYVSKCLYYLCPEIRRCLDYKLIASKTGPDEKKSRYFLVLAGLFHNQIPPEFLFRGYKLYISDGFRQKEELRSLSLHVDVWLDILHEIESKGWLAPLPKPKKKQLLLADSV